MCCRVVLGIGTLRESVEHNPPFYWASFWESPSHRMMKMEKEEEIEV